MPKVKKSLIKSSKLASNRKFNFSRSQLLTILAVLSLVGVVLVFKTFASGGVIHGYFWNSPGIGHNEGRATVVNTDRGTVTAWMERSGDVGGHYMWFGPYANFNGSGTTPRSLRVCWAYIPPGSINAKVIFDVVWHDSKGFYYLYNSSHYAKTIPYSGYISGSGQAYTLLHECHNLKLAARAYTNLEIRTRVTSVGGKTLVVSADDNSFRLRSTSWQIIE